MDTGSAMVTGAKRQRQKQLGEMPAFAEWVKIMKGRHRITHKQPPIVQLTMQQIIDMQNDARRAAPTHFIIADDDSGEEREAVAAQPSPVLVRRRITGNGDLRCIILNRMKCEQRGPG